MTTGESQPPCCCGSAARQPRDAASGSAARQPCCPSAGHPAGPAPAPADAAPPAPAATLGRIDAPWCDGTVATPVGDVPRVRTTLTARDRFGTIRVRSSVGRMRYRVTPGLYAVGAPESGSPVLVSANYKLSFDQLRRALAGRGAWILVLDTRGINVWCAAGKGTFGTAELARRVLSARLDEAVSHRTLVLPQLGAPGVAAHEIEAFTGFQVVYGPARAEDIPAFLAAGMRATPEMREVTFSLRDRFVLTGTELALAWNPKVLIGGAAIVLASGIEGLGFSWDAVLVRGGTALLAGLGGLVAGGFVTPLLLPWLPFRAFSAKGALVGSLFAAALVAATVESIGWIAAAGAAVALVTTASYTAMNFTGTSNITSPSGVEYEMRRAIPWQLAGTVLAAALWIVSAFV